MRFLIFLIVFPFFEEIEREELNNRDRALKDGRILGSGRSGGLFLRFFCFGAIFWVGKIGECVSRVA